MSEEKPESPRACLNARAVGAVFVSPALQRGENASIGTKSPVGTAPATRGRNPGRIEHRLKRRQLLEFVATTRRGQEKCRTLQAG